MADGILNQILNFALQKKLMEDKALLQQKTMLQREQMKEQAGLQKQTENSNYDFEKQRIKSREGLVKSVIGEDVEAGIELGFKEEYEISSKAPQPGEVTSLRAQLQNAEKSRMSMDGRLEDIQIEIARAKQTGDTKKLRELEQEFYELPKMIEDAEQKEIGLVKSIGNPRLIQEALEKNKTERNFLTRQENTLTEKYEEFNTVDTENFNQAKKSLEDKRKEITDRINRNFKVFKNKQSISSKDVAELYSYLPQEISFIESEIRRAKVLRGNEQYVKELEDQLYELKTKKANMLGTAKNRDRLINLYRKKQKSMKENDGLIVGLTIEEQEDVAEFEGELNSLQSRLAEDIKRRDLLSTQIEDEEVNFEKRKRLLSDMLQSVTEKKEMLGKTAQSLEEKDLEFKTAKEEKEREYGKLVSGISERREVKTLERSTRGIISLLKQYKESPEAQNLALILQRNPKLLEQNWDNIQKTLTAAAEDFKINAENWRDLNAATKEAMLALARAREARAKKSEKREQEESAERKKQRIIESNPAYIAALRRLSAAKTNRERRKAEKLLKDVTEELKKGYELEYGSKKAR